MFLNHLKILPPFIALHLVTMSFLNFTLISFFIKNRELRKTLLESRSKGGLYPLPCSTPTSASSKQVFSIIKVSTSRWHACLGHPSLAIVRFVLSKNSLPFSSSLLPEYVCDTCQQAKCHQLSYPISTSTSKAPLELIFSDVWVRLVTQFIKINIMLVSSMILVNSRRFIC
jgi:hypothetical protein